MDLTKMEWDVGHSMWHSVIMYRVILLSVLYTSRNGSVDRSGKLRLFRFGHKMRSVLLFSFQVPTFFAFFEGGLLKENCQPASHFLIIR